MTTQRDRCPHCGEAIDVVVELPVPELFSLVPKIRVEKAKSSYVPTRE